MYGNGAASFRDHDGVMIVERVSSVDERIEDQGYASETPKERILR